MSQGSGGVRLVHAGVGEPVKGVRGPRGSQYLRRASHTLTLLSTLHQETTARVDMCTNNHFSFLVTWYHLFMPNNTKRDCCAQNQQI